MIRPAAVPEHPAELLSALLEESRQLRADTRERERRQRRTNQLTVAGIVVVLLMLGVLLIILVQNQQRATVSRALLRDNVSTSAQIADCTTAGGKCYEQGQRRSAEAVQQLINADVVIARCARSTDTDTQLQRCVDAGFADLLKPSPAPSVAPSPSPALPR
jgi:type II secretory pathway pseudopilin PulG